MSGDWLAMGAVGALAVAGAVRRRGSAAVDLSSLHLVERTERPGPGLEPVRWATGVSVTFQFARNTESSPWLGERYAQDVEPAGRYVVTLGVYPKDLPPGWIHGSMHFDNPIVLASVWPVEGDYSGAEGWKHKLSEAFGGKRGLALTRALIAAGYDGIVTVSMSGPENRPGYVSEIVDLTTMGQPKNPRRGGRNIAFRRWFKKSKVVNSQGQPLLVFHGSDADEPFEAFDPALFGQKQGGKIDGFYFAARRATADAYRSDDYTIKGVYAQRWKDMHREETRLKKEMVRAWNAHYGTDYSQDAPEDRLKDAQGEWVLFDRDLPESIQKIKAALGRATAAIWRVYEDQENSRSKFWNKAKAGVVISAYLSLQNPLIIDAHGAAWSRDFENQLRAMLSQRGERLHNDYDGLILKNFYDGEVGLRDDIYVAFRPEQIKALDNRGTWDRGDPPMSFNRRTR